MSLGEIFHCNQCGSHDIDGRDEQDSDVHITIHRMYCVNCGSKKIVLTGKNVEVKCTQCNVVLGHSHSVIHFPKDVEDNMTKHRMEVHDGKSYTYSAWVV
jgi:hypothetical protein